MTTRRLVALAITSGCGLFPDLSGLSDAGLDATGGIDATPDVVDAAPDAADSGSEASCSCPANLVSAYLLSDPTTLGHDAVGSNHFTTLYGSPQRSSTVPNGLSGYSIQLDGSSSVCMASGFTFDSTSDHTLCWWSQPTVLGNSTNQFAQDCSYDTWTTSSGADYLWRINNCNGGTTIDFQVPGIYSAGQWTQICQTYTKSTMTRVVVVNGQTAAKLTHVDTAPIVEPASNAWCIGSYGGGGFWTGFIYRPLWFSRVLSDAEIQEVFANACCF
jgi:concanavalin A-like lectin/glucanase superfamily protein